jgi:GNAT superfamily N-acetyltransferase
MPLSRLRAVAFLPEMARSGMVQAFDCGGQPWELEVSDWLKAGIGAGSAADELNEKGGSVWLYLQADADELVGVGSLGVRSDLWSPCDVPVAVSYIPGFAVDQRYVGQGYGGEIFRDLLIRAVAVGHTRLVLHVHVDNPAVNFNTKHDFEPIGNPESIDGSPAIDQPMVRRIMSPGQSGS